MLLLHSRDLKVKDSCRSRRFRLKLFIFDREAAEPAELQAAIFRVCSIDSAGKLARNDEGH